MGFKPWRNMSILFLAGAALVGCNNTSQKDKSVVSGPSYPMKSPPGVAGTNSTPGPNFPTGSGSQQPFPTRPLDNTNPAFPGQAKPVVPPQSPFGASAPGNPYNVPPFNAAPSSNLGPNSSVPLNGGGSLNVGSTNPNNGANRSFVPTAGSSVPAAPLPLPGPGMLPIPTPGSSSALPPPGIAPSSGFGADYRTTTPPSDVAPIQPPALPLFPKQ